ncbi:MAG TPA: dihydrolipoyllysine-residue succinyltransferase [Candidatus Eisenbacteria bacterium]|nr:dihydrolipoyllysine-residue succinyltransferase [Candidatus Eisenbacteria bacterium]
MPVTIVVPQLGESVVEGTIGKWLKKVGDPIAKDEPIVEIITDKINIELPSPAAGTLGAIAVPEGQVAQVGDPLGQILAAGESASAAPAAPKPAAAGSPAPQPAAPQPARETAGAPAPSRPAPSSAPAYATAVAAPPSTDGQRLSPAVRKLAKEHQVDVGQIRGSGMGGRVTREDVLTHLEARQVAASAPSQAAAAAPGRAPEAAPQPKPLKPIPTPAFATAGARESERKPLTNIRKKIAENMVKSRHTAAHCSSWDEVDMTNLVELRKRLKDRVRMEYGVGLTYMPFIMRAVVRALKEYPILNASMTDTEVELKKYYNIGVAVHRDQGLIVPVVHDADRKTLLQLAAEIDDLGRRARNDKLTLDDIQGGTFTITNAGMFGATASTPIINVPEVGILGVHLIQERPVVRDHRIAVRWMMNLVISFDHRLVDGTPAVQFLHRVKELLEDPESWLLDSVG